MVRSRVILGIWLLFAVLLCFLAPGRFTFLLLAVSVLLPFLMLFLTFLGVRRIDGAISSAAYGGTVGSGEKGSASAAAGGRLMLVNRSLIPLDRVLCRVNCHNLLTGEKQTAGVRTSLPAKGSAEEDIRLKSRHAGKIRMTLNELRVFDPFGLYCFKRPVRSEKNKTTVLFVPETFSVTAEIAYGESMNMDSEEYSMKKPGNDPSETFAIREYRAGDRIRQIHWKLTEKLDQLTVRDYGLPIQNTILLLLETGYEKGGTPAGESLNALGSAILSLSQELISGQIVHSIGWQNHEENTFSCMEVETDEDLSLILPDLLGAVPGEDALSVLDHYMESREQMEFAHVVVFTPHHQAQLEYMADQCLITEVVIGGEEDGYERRGGMALIGATPETAQENLAYMEI